MSYAFGARRMESESLLIDSIGCRKPIYSREGLRLYDLFVDEEFPPVVETDGRLEDVVGIIYGAFGQAPPRFNHTPIATSKVDHNGKLLVVFSGGLDSAYVVLKALDEGYDVTLLHFRGLNSYMEPNESVFSSMFAEKYGLAYMEYTVHKKGHSHWSENPFKNQMLLMSALDVCVERNIGNIALGSDYRTPISESTVGLDITDSLEVNEAILTAMEGLVEGLSFYHTYGTRMDRYSYIEDNHPEAMECIYSCVLPSRFLKTTRERNESKYGVSLLPTMCGSCMKCCMEWLMLHELGLVGDNGEFEAHCWETVGKPPYGDVAKFGRGVTKGDRMKNLISYGG